MTSDRDSAPTTPIGSPPSSTITVLAIPADPARPHRLVAVDPSNDTALKALAGGGLEPVDLDRDGAVLWMADPPLPAGTPRNDRATALAAFGPRRFHPDLQIHGNVIITGITRGNDVDLLDVPASYARLLDAPRYRVQIRHHHAAGGIVLGDAYPSLLSAYDATRAAAHATRRSRPTAWLTARVTPLDTAPPAP